MPIKLFRLLLPLMLLSSIALFGALDPQAAAYPLPQDPAVLSGSLSNGLKYYIQQNDNPAGKVELRLFVNAGSIVEDEDQLGLAHFTEHMLFNGTKSFPKGQMIDFLNSVGMGYMNGLNGMTSFDFTMYMFSLPTGDDQVLDTGFKLLAEMAHDASFDPVELEKERGVIIEEWRMGQNSDSRIREQTGAAIYGDSRYATRNPIGTYDVISSFDRDTILRFYRDWYRPDLQTVVVVGDIDPEDALAYIDTHFGPIPASEDPRPRVYYPVPSHEEPRSVVATDHELSRSSVSVIWKRDGKGYSTMGDFYDLMIRNLFYGMINMRLGEHSFDENPPYSGAYAFEYTMTPDLSQIYLTAEIDEDQAENALETLLLEVERVRQHGFTTTEIERAKQNILRQYQNAMAEEATRESSRITWSFFAPALRGHALMSPSQEFALANMVIPEISLEETNALITRLIGSQNQVFVLEAVEKADAHYPTADDLMAVASRVENVETDVWEDSSSQEPLIAELPEPGSIVATRKYPGSGIKRWTLSNGLQLYYLKTDFNADEILISATSDGGYAALEESDLTAAKFLGQYLSESGIGDIDFVNLSKMMSGKIIELNPTMGIYSEGFDGSCSPADLETLMQLIYQYAYQPRWDQTALNSLVSRNMPFYRNRSLDPETVFFDSLFVVSRNTNPYTANLHASDLPEISLDALERVHRERLAEFADFDFLIVGNFDEAELERMAKLYLANLPHTRSSENLRDVGIRPVMGQHEIVFEKGGAQKSYVGLITNGPSTSNPTETVQRNAMMMVLNEKLRENIREERSGVYFVQSYLTSTRFPSPYSSLYTFMSCSSDRVEELSDAILATMDSLKAGLFDDKYVETARVTMLQNHQQRMRQNRYWISNMQQSLMQGRPIDQFLDNPSLIEKVTKENITQMAQKYLNTDQSLIKLIMNPESTK